MVLRGTPAAAHAKGGAADTGMLHEHRSSGWREESNSPSGEGGAPGLIHSRSSPPVHAGGLFHHFIFEDNAFRIVLLEPRLSSGLTCKNLQAKR
jgi:hypothetical protein